MLIPFCLRGDSQIMQIMKPRSVSDTSQLARLSTSKRLLAGTLILMTMLMMTMLMVSTLSLVGLALIGTVLSVISFNTRAREAMLPILFLPVIVPILIAAVECTKSILLAESVSSYRNWLELMLVFDVIYLVMCPYGFSLVIAD